MCELNVAKSVFNVAHTTIVQNAWQRGQSVAVHGWCYRYDLRCVFATKTMVDVGTGCVLD